MHTSPCLNPCLHLVPLCACLWGTGRGPVWSLGYGVRGTGYGDERSAAGTVHSGCGDPARKNHSPQWGDGCGGGASLSRKKYIKNKRFDTTKPFKIRWKRALHSENSRYWNVCPTFWPWDLHFTDINTSVFIYWHTQTHTHTHTPHSTAQ
jgi:hypothetical protein